MSGQLLGSADDLRLCEFEAGGHSLRVVWRREPEGFRVHYIAFEDEDLPTRWQGASVGSCAEMDAFAERVRRYMAGEPITFDLSCLAMDDVSPFQRSVLIAEYNIPRGQVSTYGLVAQAIGSPRASRAVGSALARNPFPIIVPCHRAVRANGALGGFRGGLEIKRELLTLEGVEVTDGNHVSVERYYYADVDPAPADGEPFTASDGEDAGLAGPTVLVRGDAPHELGRESMERVERAVSTRSKPSQLEITDLRVARVAATYDYVLLRIDTNQGVYGIGESHESSHIENVLQYKSMLLGQNPCNVDMIFKAIKPFGNWGTEGGGVSGIEMALWDLVGRVYGAPCYQFLGGKYRDSVRLYADTPSPDEPTPEGYAARVLERKAQGATIIKFDVGIQVLDGYVPGGKLAKPAKTDYALGKRFAARGLVGTQLTDAGVARYREIVGAVRDAVGPEIPLAIDHFGPISVKDAIKIGKALDGYGIAWLEDMLPVSDWRGNQRVTAAIPVPTLNGEQGYLLDGLRKLIEEQAVDILQPDLVTVGGMSELKRVADYAEERGIPTVLHCAGSPVMFMANVHCAAAIRSFVAQEIHSLDIPFWRDLVIGLDDPLIVDGYVQVPDRPGLGIELNEDVIRDHLRYGGYFDATPDWDRPKLGWWIPND